MILPFVYPEIRCYQHHAAGISIIQANVSEEEFNRYISGNFIQLNYCKNLDMQAVMDFFTPLSDLSSPLLNTMTMSREYADVWCNDIIDFVIHNLDNRCYLYTPVNVHFIKAYQMNNGFHPILIYGYDRSASVFYAADYFTHTFQPDTVPFDEFGNAYKNVAAESYWWQGVKVIEFTNKLKYELDLENIINLFEDYLYSRDTSIRYRMNRNYHHSHLGFGISLYERLRYDLVNLPLALNSFDLRAYAVLVEHKKVVSRISRYLFPTIYSGKLQERIEDMIDKCLLLQNMVLKVKMNKASDMNEGSIRLLESIEELDKAYAADILELLYKC